MYWMISDRTRRRTRRGLDAQRRFVQYEHQKSSNAQRPSHCSYEFMRNSSYKKTDLMGEGFRLRTQKFRGQLSQGLLLPLSQFPEIPANADVGTNVTEILGIRKREIGEKATTSGTVIGTLPYDIPHTDETLVQAEPELIRAFSGLEYYISTKMDGSSHSIGIDENGFHVPVF